jgi:ferric-dicitrate binding protein FerR (iron transport regulator)
MENLEKKIERFLNNEASPEEGEEIFLYFKMHPEVLEKYITVVDLFGKSEQGKISKALAKRMADQLKSYIDSPGNVRRNPGLWIRYAAVFVGVVILTASWWWIKNNRIPASYQAEVSINENTVTSLITIKNSGKGKKIVHLDDGSEVTLNEEAKISFNKPFGMKDRNIVLTGNAVFKVAKDTAKSFCVTSRGINTIAVGTEFRIQPDKQGILISLYEGKVKVRQVGAIDQTAVLMTQGQVLRVDSLNFAYRFEGKKEEGKPGRTLQASRKDSVRNSSSDLIVFRKATLNEVFKSIEEKFGVEIIYRNSDIETKARFTGRFKKNETPGSIIASICAINELTYSINGNTITVTKQQSF